MGPGARKTISLAPAVVLAAGLAPALSAGGDWHRDGALVCSDCHTMHNSKGGQPMRYDLDPGNAALLLRAATATEVCLSCHRTGGVTIHAPGVTAPSNWDPPGGGFPADLSDPGRQAHALGPAPILPPYGDTPVVLGCTTCHAPHGNDAYRNLLASPSGTGRAGSAPAVSQVVTADGTNPAEVYVRSNVRYAGGTSAWCMDCHNLLAADHSTGGGSPAHPWDLPIFGSPSADWTAWSGAVANRVPVENPAGVPPPDPGDRVFCLSCHKAHGSPNAAALIHADGITQSSTCQQCHAM